MGSLLYREVRWPLEASGVAVGESLYGGGEMPSRGLSRAETPPVWP